YNTRSAFEHYDDNLEHTRWLAMMWPRLELLRDLLAEDGSIWVSIDDNEVHYLKVIMDEVFGRRNFLTNFVWQKSYGGGSKAKWFVGLHENIVCYAKNIDKLPELWLPPDPDAKAKYYKLKDQRFEKRGPYRLQPLATTSMDNRPNLRYPIQLPSGEEIWPEKQWQWSKERVEAALRDDELVISKKKSGKTVVSYKQYFKDKSGNARGRKPVTIVTGHYTQHGSYESMALFGLKDKFAFPKPEGLIHTIFECCTNPGDLVLDSFLGSGTTAAVAHKMGRQYIGIEMGDHAVSHCAPRLNKVIAGEQGGISKSAGWQGGGGFRFYRLGPPAFDAHGCICPDIRFPVLAAHIWFAETGRPWDGWGNGREDNSGPSLLLGVHEGRALALLYNGVLGDKRPNGGNVLTRKTLATVRAALIRAAPGFGGPLTVYGERSRLPAATLEREGVAFKQTPYDVKARR
ncbi:MAG: site-specific DNA-methyltransferase, partial [Rhodospirillaceae bacterium]|nr:site-specific DNA-methyltransferase [Rhodospirillaceae bacterium]